MTSASGLAPEEERSRPATTTLALQEKVLEVDAHLARNGQPLLAIVAQCEVRPGEEVVGDGE
jgi:hypothetical protein